MRVSHVVALMVAAAGLVALGVSVVKLWPVGRSPSPSQQASAGTPAVIADRSVINRERFSFSQEPNAVGAALAAAIPPILDSVDKQGRDSFCDAVRAAFAAYFAEHKADFNAYLESTGVAPIGLDSPSDSPEWLGFKRTVAKAGFDSKSVRVRARMRDGVASQVPAEQAVSMTSERPAARPSWAQSPSNTSEIVVDGIFNGYSGEEFEARFGLEFAYDRQSGRWVLLKARMYGVPQGVLVVPPPA